MHFTYQVHNSLKYLLFLVPGIKQRMDVGKKICLIIQSYVNQTAN